MGVVAGRLLHFGGEIEQVEEFVVREVEIREEIGCGGFGYLVRINMVATESASTEFLFT